MVYVLLDLIKLLAETKLIPRAVNGHGPVAIADRFQSVPPPIPLFGSVQFDTLFNTRFSEVVGLLEEVAFQSTP